jgi:hypothetical protein
MFRASCQRKNLLTRPNGNDDKVLGIGKPTISDFRVFLGKRKTCVNCLCSLQAVRNVIIYYSYIETTKGRSRDFRCFNLGIFKVLQHDVLLSV